MRAAGTGRSHRLAVTDAGIALYDRAMRRVVALNVELAHAMSTDERHVLDDILRRVWLQRADRYSELRRPEQAEVHRLSKVEMYRIGG